MIDYSFGNYGLLKQGKMENPPLTLLDLGVERRFGESYHFENADRISYGGYLLQYTLKGFGIFETYKKNADGTASGMVQDRFELTPGRGFFSRIPEASRYYLPAVDTSPKDCGFLNGNYFAKVFRRYLGCSPEEYRRRNRC